MVGTDDVDLLDFVDLTDDMDAVRLRNDDFADGVELKLTGDAGKPESCDCVTKNPGLWTDHCVSCNKQICNNFMDVKLLFGKKN